MTWSIEELRAASLDELARWTRQPVATLIQLHAIAEFARRALEDTQLLPEAIRLVGDHLGWDTAIGGMPVGYFGARVLHEHGGTERQALMALLATVDPVARDDLLRWLDPAAREKKSDDSPSMSLEELVFETRIDEDGLRNAITELVGSTPEDLELEVAPLADGDAVHALVSMPPRYWDEVERRGTRLSAILGTTVLWWPPEEIDALGPDVRVAVRPDGTRQLVIARHTDTGYHILPYDGDP